ncbi:MAG: ABC transporter substrate-binding protein [Clostridia bacterium]|nr:ABC transporter substrate-binding protein [Clostridia bacterium]MBR2175479.1 ABC transporter substrate-binding protein [Clostridia bacterium]
MKKIIALAAASVLMLSTAACSVSSGKEYPVTVANHTFTTKPTSVVCLSDSVADILIACGYSDAITARTDECTQEELSSVPTVGSKHNPNVKKIEDVSPDVVFTDSSVSEDVIRKLDGDNVKVMNMIKARNGDELTILYRSIGAVMDGDESGKENGKKKAASLLGTLDKLSNVIKDSDVVTTVCYLYDENGTAATSSSLCGKLFDYAKLDNICTSDNTNVQQNEAIRLSNPQYIFCADGVKEKLLSNEEYAGIDAVKNGKVYEINADVFERQGDTMTEVLSYIIETVHPELVNSPDPDEDSSTEDSKQESSKEASNTETNTEPSKQESKDEASKPESSTEPSKQESKAETSKQESSKITADQSLDITDDVYFGQGDNDEEFKKVQQRLKNLGYFNDDVTGYFGEISAAAFKAFEKNNGLDVDGFASTEDLRLLFSDKVKAAPQTVSENP